MADDDDDPGGEEGKKETGKPTGRTRGAKATSQATSARPSRSASSRLERRAGKVKETILEAVKWRLKDQADDDLDLVHTVQRDADPIGHAVAAVGEHFKPFGAVIDLLFGEAGPLAIFVALAPTIRAARREAVVKLQARAERKRVSAEQAAAERDGVTLLEGQPDNPGWAGDSVDPLTDPALDFAR